jgi:membrane-bound transcription factor site-1 protease
MKQALVESSARLPELNQHEQGAGKLALPAAAAVLKAYAPRASLIPGALHLDDCPYMWPHCIQPLHAHGLPRMINATIVNGMANTGRLEGAPVWTPSDEGGALLGVSFEWSDVLWPWSGYLAVYIQVWLCVCMYVCVMFAVGLPASTCPPARLPGFSCKTAFTLVLLPACLPACVLDCPSAGLPRCEQVSPAGEGFNGMAHGTITFTVVSPPQPGSREQQRSTVTVPLSARIQPTPPRSRRVLWDVLHSVKYPPGYVPRDNLDIKVRHGLGMQGKQIALHKGLRNSSCSVPEQHPWDTVLVWGLLHLLGLVRLLHLSLIPLPLHSHSALPCCNSLMF